LDEIKNQQLIDAAQDLPVTLHRAFDMCENPFTAFDTAAKLGFHRILTSGQQQTAELGLELLQKLTEKNNPTLKIMAGSGVSAKNIPFFLQAGIQEIHLSGHKAEASNMVFKQPNVKMATTIWDNEYTQFEASYDLIRAAVEATIIQK
jgi:copper homeostasis protein